MKKIAFRTLLGMSFSLFFTSPAWAQEDESASSDDYFAEFVLEEERLPLDSLTLEVSREIGSLQSGMPAFEAEKLRKSLYGMFAKPDIWLQPVVTVCFQSSDTELNSQVSRIASEWSDVGARVKLDFGALDNPRQCSGAGKQDVSVAFGLPNRPDKGGSSLVGRGSTRGYPSMVLGGLRAAQGNARKFRFMILHEFGHALGLRHELKNADAECWKDIDEEALVKYYDTELGVNNIQAIRTQIRTYDRADMKLMTSTGFDKKSTLMYALPKEVFRSGEKSECFAPINSVISPGDKATLKAAYTGSLFQMAELARISADSGVIPATIPI